MKPHAGALGLRLAIDSLYRTGYIADSRSRRRLLHIARTFVSRLRRYQRPILLIRESVHKRFSRDDNLSINRAIITHGLIQAADCATRGSWRSSAAIENVLAFRQCIWGGPPSSRLVQVTPCIESGWREVASMAASGPPCPLPVYYFILSVSTGSNLSIHIDLYSHAVSPVPVKPWPCRNSFPSSR